MNNNTNNINNINHLYDDEINRFIKVCIDYILRVELFLVSKVIYKESMIF